MTRTLVTSLIVALVAVPLSHAQQADEAANWQRVASVTPLGSRVKVDTADRRRYSGTLMQVTDTGIVIKRATRLPEPPVTVTFDRITRLEQDRGGLSVAKALGIGVAAGAGAVMTLIMMALAFSD
jgi:hypothetical protein